MNIYEQVKQALQDVVAPELKAVQVEIRRLDDRINSQKAEIVAEIRRLDEKVDNVDDRINSQKTEILTEIRRLDEKIDNVDEKIDTAIQIRERLAALEAKFAAMER